MPGICYQINNYKKWLSRPIIVIDQNMYDPISPHIRAVVLAERDGTQGNCVAVQWKLPKATRIRLALFTQVVKGIARVHVPADLLRTLRQLFAAADERKV